MPEPLDSSGKSSPVSRERQPNPTLKKPRKRKVKLHPALVWCRSIGLFSVLAGALGMIQQFFWFSVASVCIGLLLLSVDLYFEPELPRGYKIVGGIIVAACLIWFNLSFVIVSAPLTFNSLASNSDYALGGGPGGIAWRSVFVELDFMATNPTDSNYDNIDMVVRPDYPVAAIAQLSNLSDVSFEDYYGVTNRVTVQDLSTQVGVPLVFLATDAGYKIHCGRIPPKSSLRLVMAVVDTKKSAPTDPQKPIILPREVSPDDFILEQSFDTKGDKATYWFGSAKNLSIYAPGAKPKKIIVSGSYTAINRRRNVKQEIVVH
jgi:hypothetical protein